MRMNITATNFSLAMALFVAIGIVIGWGVALARAGRTSTSGEYDPPRPGLPRVRVAIARAAAAMADCRNTVDEALVDEVADDLVAGPRVWVDLDTIERLETGHLPVDQRDFAIGTAGERGRYQIMQAAWTDAMKWMKRNRGYEIDWIWDVRAHDVTYSNVIASTYLNEVLPRQLTARRLDDRDSTNPVPDCLDARVAAYNAGAKRVRQAYALWKADAGTTRPWTSYLPKSTIEYLAKYHKVAERMSHRATENTEKKV